MKAILMHTTSISSPQDWKEPAIFMMNWPCHPQMLCVVLQAYKDYVKAIMTRTNSITSVQYLNDPAIFAGRRPYTLLMTHNPPRMVADPHHVLWPEMHGIACLLPQRL